MDYFRLRARLHDLDVSLEEQVVDFDWSQPTQAGKGLLSSSCSFKLGKQLGQPPVEIAQRLEGKLNQAVAGDSDLQRTQFKAEGPFINLYLSQIGYQELLQGGFSGFKLPIDERKVMFEYIGANVAKRLHAGHMRNLNIGEALRRVLSLRYPNLVTDNHWGDWGVQFGVLLWAYKQAVDESAFAVAPMDELQRLYVWGNAQESEVKNWAEKVREEFRKLEQGDETNTELWEQFLTISKQELQHDLKLLNVPETDLNQGESYYEPWMSQLQKLCDKHELWTTDGQARYVDFERMVEDWSGQSDDATARIAGLGRAYFVSSQGYTTYVFRDVAARLQWAEQHQVDLAITLTDNRQQHNFKQAFAFISYLATTPEFIDTWGEAVASRLQMDALRHVGYGHLSLSSGTLSSRQGGALRLSDIFQTVQGAVEAELAERGQQRTDADVAVITRAALKWQDLKTDPNTDITLDPEQAVSFEGDTGVYQLYTHARLKSILRKADQTSGGGEEIISASLLHDQERALLLRAYELHEELNLAAHHMNVSPFVNKLGDVTRAVNAWYESTNVLQAERDRQQALIAFVDYVAETISSSLALIGIDTVEEL